MSETAQQVNPKRLAALVKEGLNTKSKTAEIAGSFGERVKDAIESGNLHRGAFNDVKKLAGMDELKRLELIRTRQLYFDMLTEQGFFGATHLGDLAEKAKTDADKEFENADPNKAAGAANAKALKNGIGKKPAKDVKEAADRAETKAAEKAAKAAVNKTIDDEARELPSHLRQPATTH